MTSIFVCYRRSDSQDAAGRVYDRLIAHFGRNAVFKDVDDLPLAMPFPKHVKEAVEQAKVVLVILGPSWLTTKDAMGNRRIDDVNRTGISGERIM